MVDGVVSHLLWFCCYLHCMLDTFPDSWLEDLGFLLWWTQWYFEGGWDSGGGIALTTLWSPIHVRKSEDHGKSQDSGVLGRNSYQEGDGFCTEGADLEILEFSAVGDYTSSVWPSVGGSFFQRMLKVLRGNSEIQGHAMFDVQISCSSRVNQGWESKDRSWVPYLNIECERLVRYKLSRSHQRRFWGSGVPLS